ncbi:MAG: cell division protein FtsA C-terminal domain-containing protein, partial [Lactococcus garvieae]
ASQEEYFPVDVVGQTDPEEITEYYLSQIIEARLTQIFSRVKSDLENTRSLDYPGGIVVLGGAAAMPGTVNLATKVIGMNARLFVPSEMGLRNPAFAQVISVVNYVGERTDIDRLVSQAIASDSTYVAPVAQYEEPVLPATDTMDYEENNFYQTEAPTRPVAQPAAEPEEEKEGVVDRMRNMFSNLFD